jgi:hypothetical protein
MCRKHYMRWRKHGTTDSAAMGKAEHGASPVCEVGECGRPSIAKGLCSLHYQRAKHGRPLEGPLRCERGLPLAVRVLRYVAEDESGCWVWQGSLNSDGYGNMNVGGRTVGAYRVSYEAFIGPIPDGLHLDHTCRNKGCVNPRHLEPVTNAENQRRARLSAEEHRQL